MFSAQYFASRIANWAVGGLKPLPVGLGTPAQSPTAQYPGLPTHSRVRSVAKIPRPRPSIFAS